MVTVGLLHDLGQIVVVNDGFRRGSLLAKVAGYVPQGQLVRIVLRRRPDRPKRRQENDHQKQPNCGKAKHERHTGPLPKESGSEETVSSSNCMESRMKRG